MTILKKTVDMNLRCSDFQTYNSKKQKLIKNSFCALHPDTLDLCSYKATFIST